jgi:PKD repeat protein
MTVGTAAGCSYALSKNVAIYESPVVDFEASEEAGTPPLAVDFENNSTGATTYSWQLNGMEFSTEDSPQKTFTELGDYVVDLVAISDKGCKDSKSMVINIIIPRTELALEQFNLIKEAATNLVRNQLVVKNNSNYKIKEFDVLIELGNGTTLRERINDVIVPGGTSTFLLSNSLVGVSSGYVCVELVIPNDLETDNNKKCNPLQEVTILFNPSPNPAHDIIRLEIIAAEPVRALAWIVNSLGERVAEVLFDIETGLNVRSMDVSNLNPGLYFLVLEANGQKAVHRIVLQ